MAVRANTALHSSKQQQRLVEHTASWPMTAIFVCFCNQAAVVGRSAGPKPFAGRLEDGSGVLGRWIGWHLLKPFFITHVVETGLQPLPVELDDSVEQAEALVGVLTLSSSLTVRMKMGN